MVMGVQGPRGTRTHSADGKGPIVAVAGARPVRRAGRGGGVASGSEHETCARAPVGAGLKLNYGRTLPRPAVHWG